MTVDVPVDAGRRLRVDYECDCGQPRAVMAFNLDPRLPIHGGWRDTGPCPGCGEGRRWRIERIEGAWRVQVEPFAEA